ncbi:cation:proton antiporter [Arenimonas sp.]|uniref:cation:proton antiporter n=1 Tax=Arenimonas sp. TaxID=1872635 RepID=UPI0039E2532D
MSSSGTDANPKPSKRLWLGYLALVILPLAAGLVWLSGHVGPVSLGLDIGTAGLSAWTEHLQSPFARFLCQMLVVLAAAKLLGALMRRLRQPAVIGEMIAGLMLGPSLFGWLVPESHAWLFRPDSLQPLSLIAQLGVLVFMFAAGAEFEPEALRGHRRRALLIGHAGIAIPFLMGLLLAAALYADYAPAGTNRLNFSLFIGIAMSITAFPVLLRILEDRGYTQLPIGRIATSCAALADATAWAVLGVIIAMATAHDTGSALVRLLPAFLFAWFCLVWLRRKLAAVVIRDDHAARWLLAMVLSILLGSLITEALGLHALFGAFLAGLAFSGNQALRALVVERIESFATVLLLPLYFASTGLRTQLELLGPREWSLCLAITAIATLGKMGGTVLSARFSGLERADSWRLGALMNTRGLMELIVLGLGLEFGLIGHDLYAIFVIAAIATTVMTGPLLSLIDRVSRSKATA